MIYQPNALLSRLAVALFSLLMTGCISTSKRDVGTTTKELAQVPRIGDPGWVFDEQAADPRFPEMAEWAKAGVQGGIPYRHQLPLRLTLQPGEALQSAIDDVAEQGGGVILLKKGVHTVGQTVRLRSGVVLRGEHKDSTVLSITMKKEFFKYAPDKKSAVGFEIKNAERVGFEDLTIRYAAVAFEPYDKDDFYAEWDRKVFHEHETRDTTLFVHMVIFDSCRNSWVDNCNLLWAGAHPLGMSACEHMTLRDNFIDRAYIKKDSFHGGYYGCWGSKYCLFYNETVKRIRHFAIMLPGAAYNVVYQCNFEVDVNFHDADDGHNLIERSRIATPVWHSWHAIALGAPGKHRPPGKRNLLFANQPISKGKEGYTQKTGPIQPQAVYEVAHAFGGPPVFMADSLPPLKNTLYAVKHIGR